MNLIRKIKRLLNNPRALYVHFALKRFEKKCKSVHLSDEEYLSYLFKIRVGKKLNLMNPKSFNEKMQWLKLYNRQPIYSVMVDKDAVKDYVSRIIGEQFLIKRIGVWKSFDDINFDDLPEQFVLKTTHGCGGMLVCEDKFKINPNQYRNSFEASLTDNYYFHSREWPYKNVVPQIIAEEFMRDGNNKVLPVYKFFCFNGEPFIAQVIQNDKNSNETIDYVDMDYKLLKIRQNYPNSKRPLPMPSNFDEMKTICRKLTKGIPFVRCDLYSINGKTFFSEFTFFSDAGLERFYPEKWDYILGEKIILPNKTIND